MARALLNVPKTVKRGQVFEVKVLISHPMESGQRRDERGAIIPRDIINRFVCTYNGDLVLEADLFPAVSANPFFAFHVLAAESGTIDFAWRDDQGAQHSESRPIVVE
ncbi:sulfur-oxidizing protein SoxZ [Stella humosa]|uniref:Sulfur-oxidizing protein SoxZ n=1 Tax=Stella humosa TaxID=94 RepID=A0A3N1KPV4_9PROT|nr:thiosulfate oxidation carrier complex protein SoxZ [Stella humosa]ROP81317.1 sulfur-oxidizing protein SoxZ [Stella humosa]BBK32666.1 thiosulfate oxidation carrier complex protein SoxZ [Stella humosa]